eukprot:4732849-Amphidinium_carterae.1
MPPKRPTWRAPTGAAALGDSFSWAHITHENKIFNVVETRVWAGLSCLGKYSKYSASGVVLHDGLHRESHATAAQLPERCSVTYILLSFLVEYEIHFNDEKFE